MITLQESGDAQSFKFIGRDGVHSFARFTDEQSNVSYWIDLNGITVQADYNEISTAFAFIIEDHTYSLKVYSSSGDAFLTLSGREVTAVTDERALEGTVLFKDLVLGVPVVDNTSGNYSDVVENVTINEYTILD